MTRKNNLMVNETDTDTDGDILGAIAKQKAALEATKKKGADAGKSNNLGKRICGGTSIFTFMLL